MTQIPSVRPLGALGRKFAVFATVLVAALVLTSGVKVYAEPIDNSVLLDPFDPVPQIQFHHGGCDWGCRGCVDECGYRHCWHECGYHHCWHGCYAYRDCWHGCWHGRPWHCEFGCGPSLGSIFEERVQRYDSQADRYDAMAHHWAEQSCWYDWHVRGRVCDPHMFDHHDGPTPIFVHDGPPDGPRHDWHDGDHHDGPPPGYHDEHDGPPPDGDHHDGHDGDHHDGPPDHHDGPPDSHDGPPPDHP